MLLAAKSGRNARRGPDAVVEPPSDLRVVQPEERDGDDVDPRRWARPIGFLAFEAKVDQAPHAVIAGGAPASSGEAVYVVRACDSATPCAAAGRRLEATEVARPR